MKGNGLKDKTNKELDKGKVLWKYATGMEIS